MTGARARPAGGRVIPGRRLSATGTPPGAHTAQIWMPGAVIKVQQTSAPNGGYLRVTADQR